jgi:hypothetical protein
MFSNRNVKKLLVISSLSLVLIFSLFEAFLGCVVGPLYSLVSEEVETIAKVGAMALFFLLLGSIALSSAAIIVELVNKDTRKLLLINSVLTLAALIVAIVDPYVHFILPIFSLIFILPTAVYGTIYEIKNRPEDAPRHSIKDRLFTIIFLTCSTIALFSIFLFPLCSYDGKAYLTLVDALSGNDNLFCLISFLAFFVLYIAILVYYTDTLSTFDEKKNFHAKAKTLLYLEFALSVAFFIFSVIAAYICKSNLMIPPTTTSTFAYIPLLLVGSFLIADSFVSGKAIERKGRKPAESLARHIVIFVFSLAFGLLFLGSVFSNIIVIAYDSAFVYGTTYVNGLSVLTNYQTMSDGYKALAFLLYAMLTTQIVLLIIDIALFARRSDFFPRFSFMSICFSSLFIFALSLFGKYYEIAQNIQKETIQGILTANGFDVNVEYDAKVSSQTIYFAYASIALIVLLIVLRPFSRKSTALSNGDIATETPKTETKEETNNPLPEEKPLASFDPCPAFSALDAKEDALLLQEQSKKEKEFASPTLPSLTRFIVEYARDSRLHLFYKKEDIAQFIAGLACSKLAILQGMSGTGKTSLPKIFTEALFSSCPIIEVESSWKDKNELIGYYNEFSSTFTPKKFTSALYESALTPETITFIVLDEFNLSRIEYYFSDFLSLMENEEDKRALKLLNVPLFVSEGGKKRPYKLLEEGTTLKIPHNVWFIGTANRDESTFEISDKVYDRALTMNFNVRAKRENAFGEAKEPRFISYNAFASLLEEGKASLSFDCEGNKTVQEVENLLAPYNISFGNRILRQIETFVPVYCACFDDGSERVHEALEKILLSKVVSKLERKSVDDKLGLSRSFEELGLKDCASFIKQLNEDI